MNYENTQIRKDFCYVNSKSRVKVKKELENKKAAKKNFFSGPATNRGMGGW